MTKFFYPLILTILAFPIPAFGDIVVDNYAEAGGGGYGLRINFFGQQSSVIAQQFNTGGNTVELHEISVNITRDTATADFTATLWSSSNNNLPDVALANLSLVNAPQANIEDTYTFRPDTRFFLDGQTDYFFSIEDNISSNSGVSGSVFFSNNYIGNGNILEQVARSNDSGATWTTAGSNAILISVTSIPEASGIAILAFFANALIAVTRFRTS